MKNVGVSQSTNNAILSRFSCLQIYWSVRLVSCTHARLAAEIFLLGCSKDPGSSWLQFQANSLSTAMCDTVHSTTLCLSILHMGKCLYPGCGDWEDNMLVLVFQYWLDFTPWHFANFTSVLAFISILFLFIGNEGFQLILSFFICRSKKCAQPAVTRTTRPKVLCELYFCPKPYAINKKYSSWF